jgi:aryl-alcohol dehydrogenase-like predicted oxidoreductase
MRPIAKEHGVSIANIALAWLLHQDAVTSVIIGAKTMDQLEDNLKAVNIALSEHELHQLGDVSELPTEYPHWMIARQTGGREPDEPNDFERDRK